MFLSHSEGFIRLFSLCVRRFLSHSFLMKSTAPQWDRYHKKKSWKERKIAKLNWKDSCNKDGDYNDDETGNDIDGSGQKMWVHWAENVQ